MAVCRALENMTATKRGRVVSVAAARAIETAGVRRLSLFDLAALDQDHARPARSTVALMTRVNVEAISAPQRRHPEALRSCRLMTRRVDV